MAAPLQPDYWFEIVTGTHTDAGWTNTTTYRWSPRPFADPSTYEGGFKEGRLIPGGMDPIERTLSDPDGQYETSRFGCTVNDQDHLIRGWLGGLTTEHIVNREASIKLVSTAGRKAGTDPRIIARGRIRDPQAVAPLKFKFSGEDIIGCEFGVFAGSKQIPQRTVTRELFPGTHRDLIGMGLPIIYGEVSDSGALDAAGEPAEKGLIPVFWVGREEIGGDGWDVYLVAGHAMHGIHEVFGSDLESPAKRVKLDPSVFGSTFLVPGQTGWPFADPYRDKADGNGVTNRLTLIYATGEVSEAHKSGSINITVNGCGIEDVGDGSGDLIRHAFRCYQHAIQNWILCNDGKGYYSGAWPALTEWSLAGPTVTVMNTDSFDDAQTFSATRLGNAVGYLCDFALCERIPVREFIKRFNLSFDAWAGVNRHAQVIVKMMDDTADASSSQHYRQLDIITMPPCEMKHEAVENEVRAEYDWDAEKKKFRTDQLVVRDAVAIDALGDVRQSDVLKYYMVRDQTTANDVASRRLTRLKLSPRYQSIVLDLSGLEIDLGDIFRITHYDGLGSAGWVADEFFCVRHSIDLNKMQVTITGFDISRIIAEAAPALGDETDSPFTGLVLGDEDSPLAPPVGAYRLR